MGSEGVSTSTNTQHKKGGNKNQGHGTLGEDVLHTKARKVTIYDNTAVISTSVVMSDCLQ